MRRVGEAAHTAGPMDGWVFHGAYTIFNDPVHFSRPFIGHRRVRLIYYLPAGTKFRVAAISTGALRFSGHVALVRRGSSTLVDTRRVPRAIVFMGD